MKKKKIYIILSILTTLVLFTTAALCNWCAVQPREELVSETEEEPTEEEITEEVEEAAEEESTGEEGGEIGEATEEEPEEEEPTEEASTEEAAGESAEEELSPPTIDLEIYYGPDFSPYDAVCYYRIEAEVTGNPTPEVEFSKDDSFGAWGERKCQVNLESTSETYTLTATATNSEGTATDSIIISWECTESFEEAEAGDGEEEGEEEEVEELEIGDMGRFFEGGILPSFPVMVIHPFNIGYIIERDGVNTTDFIIGDSVNNQRVIGYIGFDWRDFEGKEIEHVVLRFETYKVHGNPAEIDILERVELKACQYLPTLEYDDYGCEGLSFDSHNFNQDTVDISSELLTQVLKSFIGRHENYGFRLYPDGDSDDDYVTDGREYTKDTISLIVWYSE